MTYIKVNNSTLAPTHYLNQCWFNVSEILWHSPESNFTASAQATTCMISLNIILLKLQPHYPWANVLMFDSWLLRFYFFGSQVVIHDFWDFIFSGRRSYVFRPQTREAREAGGHQTSGVDMYVTQERVILLDSQVHNAAILIPTILFNPKMS